MDTVILLTVCYNSAKTIGDTLDCVYASLPVIERYYIQDGGSTDETLAIINNHPLSKTGKVVVTSESDSGLYNAMNKGLRYILTECDDDTLIGIINSDDRYAPLVLETVAALSVQTPAVDVFYGNCQFITQDGSLTGGHRESVHKLTPTSCKGDMPIVHPSVFARARVYRTLGLFDERYRIAADFDWIIRLATSSFVTRYTPEIMVLFRWGGVSTEAEDASYREAIAVRIAHGSSALFEWTRYYKRRLCGLIYQRFFAS